MTFLQQPEVMQPFLVSSDTNFFFHPSTYSNSLEASCFLAKWLLLHKRQLLADLCGLLQSYSSSLMSSKHSPPCLWSIWVILTFFDDLKTFLTLLAIAGNVQYQTKFNSASSSWSYLICCFCSSFIPTYCVSTLTFLQRWCNGPVCRHSWCWWCWCWWRYRRCVGFTFFSCPPTIDIEKCKLNLIVGVLILKKMSSCVANLWLTQPFPTNVQIACLDLKW